MQRRFIGEMDDDFLSKTVIDVKSPGRTLVILGDSSSRRPEVIDLIASLSGAVEVVLSPGGVPEFDDFRRIRLTADPAEPGCVVAIGGGRVLDIGKMLATWPLHPDTLKTAVEGGQSLARRIPLVAVPTTAGSGSESTPFAVVYLHGRKHSLDHPSLLPDVAVVDYRLTAAVPRPAAAAAGLDVLCQCIESLLSRRTTPASDRDARRGLILAMGGLHGAMAREARSMRRMALAANLGGRAIAVTRTTIPHALSYPLSYRYGLAHGHAVALSMGRYLEQFGRSLSTGSGLRPWSDAYGFVLSALGSAGPSDVAPVWTRLVEGVGLPSTLAALGISRTDADDQTRAYDRSRFANSPMPAQSVDVPALFD